MKHIERMPEKYVRVFLAGDSTVQTYKEKWEPKAGWGQMIPRFFSPEVMVENHARGGRSSKSFINEGRLTRILRVMKPNDYLLIQFGHNDAKKNRPELYTSVEEFKGYLKRYVDGARRCGATPILITPVGRRVFNEATGKFKVSFPEYVQGVKEVAEELDVPLVDLSALSVVYYDKVGPKGTKLIFLHAEPRVYPAFPKGVQDNTHFQEYGAIQMANLVARAIQNLDLPLSNYVISVDHQ